MTGLSARRDESVSAPVVREDAWPPLAEPVLNVEVRASDGRAVIAVAGEVDILTARPLGDALARLTEDGFDHIVVDITEVSFFGASGLSVFAEALSALGRSGSLRVVTSSALTRRILAISGLDEVIRVHASLGEALADPPS